MKTIAMIPTYNEAGNIEKVINDILKNGAAEMEVLVVDDMSPDGTYKIVEELSKINPKIHLMLRTEKKGRGYAGAEGFKKALELGADFVLEMDGDGSHDPKYIGEFLQTIKGCDVVIGSRYVAGGKDEQRGILRRAVSSFARHYLSIVIGVDVNDPTSGFRLFKRNVLQTIAPKLKASDPFIVAEVLFYLRKNHFQIKEYPIEFFSRISGQSKLQPTTLLKYLFKSLKLRVVR
ncbi:MAG: polyprenol monophosphomannose synthase [Elusimicrobiota bacterium]|jgi:dolichol-phosphate mannosyltransferase|nr:polyprenol monophosphomannose synthase [Elusimicrobiota bacterium]